MTETPSPAAQEQSSPAPDIFAGIYGDYRCIVADPPWTFKLYSSKGDSKSPQKHYGCMSINDISALPVSSLAAQDSFLFLWTSAPLLDRAFEVMFHWGFAYKSRLSWRKTTINNKVRIGPGYVVRTMHEDVLIGARGKPCLHKPLPSLFDGLAREHSRKPDEFYSMIEERVDGPRLDLFSRESRPGWVGWGNESRKFDEGCV
jgi:N6-adenosine-specific RNA methylase IME4